MSDDSSFELPEACEKQPFKFILDSLKEDRFIKPQEVEAPPISPIENSFTRTPELPPDKKYFRIGEVSDLIGVEAYVLRYWENEFTMVRPVKSGSGHRVYSRRDVETLQVIRHLLYVEKFSIKGAKKKLLQRKRQLVTEAEAPDAKTNVPIMPAYLSDLAVGLRELIELLRAGKA